MNELEKLLNEVSDSYFDFVMGMMSEAKEHPDRLKDIIAFIKDNPEAKTSDILGWALSTLDGIDLENPKSIVVD